jgi:glycosyltransferase involved in cell wall biosynthesis
MVASFSRKKDYDSYIRAAKKILQRRDDVTFLAIGHDYTLDECKKMVGPECREKIKFIGKQENVESIVNILSIGVLATYTRVYLM